MIETKTKIETSGRMVFVENETNAGKGTSLMGADGFFLPMSEAYTEQNVKKTLFYAAAQGAKMIFPSFKIAY